MKTLNAVFGADIEKKDSTWRTGDSDPAGATFAPLRVEAAAYIYKQDVADGNEPIMLLQGGFATDTQPSIASVMRGELVGRGVPEAAILLEEATAKTIGQLRELQTIVRTTRPSKIRIISNGYHLPRIRAMIECVGELQELVGQNPEFVSAEDVLITHDPVHWQTAIAEQAKRPDLLARMAKEQRGVEQIRTGTYQF